jgi:hypothetical protein
VTAVGRTVVVAEMQARDLLRRRAVMGLLVALPAVFYYTVPATEEFSLVASTMGVSWAVAAAGTFGVLGWRQADPRLALAGAPARDGLLGRLVLLLVIALGLVALFAPQFLVRSDALIADRAVFVLALVLMALVSVPLGLAIGVLVPRELEGTLVLIGVLGVGTSVPPDTPGAWVLPLWGPLDILTVAAGWADKGLVGGVAHTLAFTAVLLVFAAWRWRRRVHVDSSAIPNHADSRVPTTVRTRRGTP